jgi:hypothetical protein
MAADGSEQPAGGPAVISIQSLNFEGYTPYRAFGKGLRFGRLPH